MKEEKVILQGDKAMKKLVAGIDLLADIVKSTLGPKGSSVMFTDHYNIPRITLDGVSVAREVVSNDDTEQMAIDALKQQAIRTNMLAGDASTTFITLSQAIIKEGLKSNLHPLQKRDEINTQCSIVLGELKKTAKPVTTYEEIKQVATVSVGDSDLGHIIAEACQKVGKEGQVSVQESEINGVRIEYTNGIEIEEGYIAEFMMNNERGEAVLNNPYILMVDSKLSNIKDILPVMQNLVDNGISEVLLLCDGLDGNMLPTIAKNKHAKVTSGANVMEIVAVKLPAVRKQEIMEDIALATQGKIFGMSTGLFPDKAPIDKMPRTADGHCQNSAYLQESKKFIQDNLGKCDKVIVTSKKTTFIGGKGDVKAKIETIKNQQRCF